MEYQIGVEPINNGFANHSPTDEVLIQKKLTAEVYFYCYAIASKTGRCSYASKRAV